MADTDPNPFDWRVNKIYFSAASPTVHSKGLKWFLFYLRDMSTFICAKVSKGIHFEHIKVVITVWNKNHVRSLQWTLREANFRIPDWNRIFINNAPYLTRRTNCLSTCIPSYISWSLRKLWVTAPGKDSPQK